MTVRAAGTVAWRDAAGGPLVALVHRPRYDDWSLPKGKFHDGEHPATAAARETEEEIGCHVALGRWLHRVTYPVQVADGLENKVVDYWAGRAGPGDHEANDEVDDVRWLPLDEAAHRTSWAHDREVLTRFAAVEPRAHTTVIVRHARARSRDAWDGDDADRPLDPQGSQQATRIAQLLPVFWLPGERPLIVSAPVRRCVDTVAPLAAATGVEVSADDRLGEHTWLRDPVTTLDCIRQLTKEPVAVACSQGGVVPYILEELAREGGLPLASPKAAKGSVWVLSSQDGQVVAADHLENP